MATTATARSAEEGEACLGCKGNMCDAKHDRDDKLASALRKVFLLTAVTAVMCVLTLIACGCSVYLYYKVNAMRTEIILAISADMADDYFYDPEYLVDDNEYQSGYDPPPDDIQADSTRRLRRKKGNKKGCKGGCVRKVRSLIKQGDIQLPTTAQTPKPTTKAPATEGQSNEPTFFGAAHYTTAVDNDYIRDHFPPIDFGNLPNTVQCQNVTEWNGKLCRNRTFQSPVAPTTLKMFKEAGWMANATRIFDYRSDGSFVAKYTGVYLLYAHVLFYDVKTKQALGLLHESGGRDTNQFRCMESVDYVNPELGIGLGSRYKSCSVNAVLYIKAGDTVKVQSLYANTEIDLTVDATYFGGVLFSTR